MTNLEILKLFVSTEESRLYEPWTEGDWTLASDGRIAVRCAKIEGVVGHPEHPENKLDLWSSNPRSGAPTPMVPLKKDPTEFADCRRCGGSKTCECKCGHKHDCIGCKGTGKLRLPPKPVEVGNLLLSDKYLWLLTQLEQPVTFYMGGNETDPVYFEFGEFQGLLMPMRKAV